MGFIDTPGVLAGNKQRIGRNYDFAHVCAWLAQRVDLVLLTFDSHKLDISDEFQEVIEVLVPYREKVRCVLNKADQIDAANLVRAYGALMWNVGKVLRTPEVARVYVSSFWNNGYRYKEHANLFDEDKAAVLEELHALPHSVMLRKINELVGRIRKVKAHLCILTQIRSKMSWWSLTFKASSLRSWLDKNLASVFDEAQKTQRLSPGDMPNLEEFRARLSVLHDLSVIPKCELNDLRALDYLIDSKMPELTALVGGVSRVRVNCQEPDGPTPRRRTFLECIGDHIGLTTESSKRRKT